PGAETRIPIAIAVIGGVLVSTVLTLFVVPSAHLIFSDFADRLARLRSRLSPENSRRPAKPPASTVANPAVGLVLLAVYAPTFVSGAALASEKTPGFTLTEALQHALNHQPSLQSAKAKISESQALESLAWSQVLPQVAGSVTANHRKDGVITGSALFGGDPYNRYGAELSASQLLFSWAAIRGIQLPKRDTVLREIEVALAEQELEQRVAAAFFDVLLADLKLQLLNTSRTVRRESLRVTQMRQKIGRSQKIDVLQVQTALALLDARIAQAGTEIQIKAAGLAELMALTDVSEIQVKGHFGFAPQERVRDLAGRLKSRILGLERVQTATERLGIERSATLAMHYPELRFVGGLSRQSYTKADLFDGAANA
ncbi:MAG: TolC family protein, partial [Bdellovibrionota bacterium]